MRKLKKAKALLKYWEEHATEHSLGAAGQYYMVKEAIQHNDEIGYQGAVAFREGARGYFTPLEEEALDLYIYGI